MTRRSIAAFDFDGTLAQGDAVLPFCASIAGYPRSVAALACEAKLVLEVARGTGDRDALKKGFVRRTLSDRSVESVEAKGRAFAESRRSKLFPRVQERVEWHREEGHELVIVSASLEVYLQPMRELLNFDAALCTRLERRNGRFTGELDGNNVRADEKSIRLREYLDGSDAQVWAYGNSRDDFAMLTMADQAFLVDKAGAVSTWKADQSG